MNSGFFRIILFTFSLIGLFVFLGYYFFSLSGVGNISTISGEVSAAAGKDIFWGLGKCSTCHSLGEEGSAMRCPNQLVMLPKFTAPIGVRAATRKPGMSAIEYMVESLYNPNAYIVKGYNKGLMRPINKPPIALEDDEITSVILYLLEKSGIEIIEETIGEVVAAQGPFRGTGSADESAGLAELISFPEVDPEEGYYVFKEMKCFQCHEIKGIKLDPSEFGLTEEDMAGGVGPDLTDIGAIQSFEYLFESIINPDAVILPDPSPGKMYSRQTGEGRSSKMPSFLDTLSAQELLDLVAFLKSLGTDSELAFTE